MPSRQRRTMYRWLTGGAMFVGLLSLSTVTWAGITGTPHDFQSKGYTGGKICIVCHTPHNADLTTADAPLWNHEVTAATFQVYTSTTLDATVGQPDGISKLCLSCHDGTVAIDNFGGTGAGDTEYVTGDALVGTDLRNDHPISFVYDDTLATGDGGLFAPTTQASGLGSTVQSDMLFGNKLECASCHDVHDNTIEPFLRKSNAASVLCLTCHDK